MERNKRREERINEEREGMNARECAMRVGPESDVAGHRSPVTGPTPVNIQYSIFNVGVERDPISIGTREMVFPSHGEAAQAQALGKLLLHKALFT